MTDVRELGFCGVDCSACPNHLSGKCPDCRHSRWPEGDPCPPVACCGERQIDCCGRCADFPCAMIMMIGWCNAGKRCTGPPWRGCAGCGSKREKLERAA